MASPEQSRLVQVTAVTLGTIAAGGLVFDLSTVELGVAGALAGGLWLVQIERGEDRLSDRTAHLVTGLLSLPTVGYFVLTGNFDHPIAGSLVTLGVLSLGRAAWVQWSMGEAFDESTHPFTPTATSDDPVAGAVRTTLANGPRTRRELWETVDAEADAVDDALTDLRERGVVNRAGSEYRLDS